MLAEERSKQQSKESTEDERQEEISTKSEEQQEMVEESESAQRHTSEQPSQSADRMEVDPPEPSNDDEDPGEIHIVSLIIYTPKKHHLRFTEICRQFTVDCAVLN